MFNNNRGQTSLTKTGILIVIITFYAVLYIFTGYASAYFNSDITLEETDVNNTNFFDFIGFVISGITEIPIWLNSIIFGSLILIITWILVSSLPTFNGGG